MTHTPKDLYRFFAYPGNHPEVMKATLLARKSYTEEDHKSDSDLKEIMFIWKPTNFSPSYYAKIDKENATRPGNEIVLNHLENMKGICSKNGLIKSLRRFYSTHTQAVESSYHIFLSTPTTFLCQPSKDDLEFVGFLKRYKELSFKNFAKESVPSKHCEENVWIVKPSFLNQGRGIEVFHNTLDVQKFMAEKNPHSTWIIQKYIEHPLLYNGRKFDIRVWALATCKGELYYYTHGYLRTSSDPFSLDKNEKWVHLTNNCFQCHGDKYGTYEEGNTLSFEVFKEYLATHFPQHNVSFENDIEARIKDLIIDTFLSIRHEYHPKNRDRCFELLGYDFMIDEDFRIWLIEVNENPYIGIPNEYIRGMLPRMINNMFRLVLDPYLKPEVDPFESETQNYWELLYSEKTIDKKLHVLKNMRRPYSTDVYPIASLKPPKNEYNPTKLSMTLSLHNKKKLQSPSKLNESVGEIKEQLGEENDKTKDNDDMIAIRQAFRGHKPKKLGDLVDELVLHYKENKYNSCCAKISNRIINFKQYTTAELDEAIEAMAKLQRKYSQTFSSSISFEDIFAKYLNLDVEGSDIISKPLIQILTAMSKDTTQKKSIFSNDILSSMFESLIKSCLSELPDTSNHLELCKILYSLGNFDKTHFYIPGETLEIEKQRRMFFKCGGMLMLLHLKSKSKNKDIQEYAQAKVSELDLRAYELQLETLTHDMEHMIGSLADTKKAKENRSSSVDPKNKTVGSFSHQRNSSLDAESPSTEKKNSEIVLNPKLVTSIDMEEMYHIISDEYSKLKQANEKKMAEQARLKQANQELKKKKMEDDRKKKEEETERAYQLMFQRYEEMKKKKLNSLKQDMENKEAFFRVQEEKRKEKLEQLRKKEKERKKQKKAKIHKQLEIEEIKALEIDNAERSDRPVKLEDDINAKLQPSSEKSQRKFKTIRKRKIIQLEKPKPQNEKENNEKDNELEIEANLRKKYTIQKKLLINNESDSEIFNIYSGSSKLLKKGKKNNKDVAVKNNIFIIHV